MSNITYASNSANQIASFSSYLLRKHGKRVEKGGGALVDLYHKSIVLFTYLVKLYRLFWTRHFLYFLTEHIRKIHNHFYSIGIKILRG